MGSRLMHLIIADQVLKRLQYKGVPEFLLGSIAPDAATSRVQKDISHFQSGNLEDGTRFVNYEHFIGKYPRDIQSTFGLGYLTHLISDDVWLKQIYFKNDLKNRVDADPNLLEKWHNDFRKLNGRLIEKFHCFDLKEALADSNLPKNSFDEIEMKDLQHFKEETIDDFTYKQEDLLKELEVYSWQEILDYVDAATDEAVRVCLSISKNAVSDTPIIWEGAAAVVLTNGKLLMIKTKESERWSIPSGGVEENESPEEACIREVWEETGFKVVIKEPLPVKKALIGNYDVTTHYFLCDSVSGSVSYHDPDDAIEEIAWKSADEIGELQHDYPEDLEMLVSFLNSTEMKEV